MDDHREIGRRYDVGPDAVVPDLPGGGEPVEHDLVATYYDTPDLRLLAAGITLRRRTGGVDAGWHLELPRTADARVEVRVPPGASVVPEQLLERGSGPTCATSRWSRGPPGQLRPARSGGSSRTAWWWPSCATTGSGPRRAGVAGEGQATDTGASGSSSWSRAGRASSRPSTPVLRDRRCEPRHPGLQGGAHPGGTAAHRRLEAALGDR